MYCSKCHFGSDVCKFPVAEARPGTAAVQYRCPQCGVVDVHLTRAPWSGKSRSMHPSRGEQGKKSKRQRNEEFFVGSPHKDVQALDYSKNAPAV